MLLIVICFAFIITHYNVFYNFPVIYSATHELFRRVFLNFQVFWDFPSYLIVISNLISLWSENTFCIFRPLPLASWSSTWSALVNIHIHSKGVSVLHSFKEPSVNLTKSSWLTVLFRSVIFLLVSFAYSFNQLPGVGFLTLQLWLWSFCFSFFDYKICFMILWSSAISCIHIYLFI